MTEQETIEKIAQKLTDIYRAGFLKADNPYLERCDTNEIAAEIYQMALASVSKALALKDAEITKLKAEMDSHCLEHYQSAKAWLKKLDALKAENKELKDMMLTETEVSAINYAVDYFEKAAYGSSKPCTFKEKLQAQAAHSKEGK
jgi:phosphoenolpyruvate carboxylase